VDRAVKCVEFGRRDDGHVSVSATPDLQPLDEFLETDIGDNLSDLELVTHHARHPGSDPWGFGGDSCHVTIAAEEVLVENDSTGQQVALSRSEFLEILRDYAKVVGHEHRES
jgi:uncharacterized protein YacL (UPF0231 family)